MLRVSTGHQEKSRMEAWLSHVIKSESDRCLLQAMPWILHILAGKVGSPLFSDLRLLIECRVAQQISSSGLICSRKT